MNLVTNFLVEERLPIIVLTLYGVGLGVRREDEGCSFSYFSFSACSTFYLAFENGNNEHDETTITSISYSYYAFT